MERARNHGRRRGPRRHQVSVTQPAGIAPSSTNVTNAKTILIIHFAGDECPMDRRECATNRKDMLTHGLTADVPCFLSGDSKL